jgi:hypothetical protein
MQDISTYIITTMPWATLVSKHHHLLHMFSTARPPSQCQYVSPKPTISPPPLHNARYAGWVRPPIQLPRVAFAIDTPSRHPYKVTTTDTRSCNSKSIQFPCLLVTRTSLLWKSPPHNFLGARWLTFLWFYFHIILIRFLSIRWYNGSR